MARTRWIVVYPALLVATILPPGIASGGAATNLTTGAFAHECQAIRMAVSIGPDIKPAGRFALDSQLVPLFIKNRGPACYLPLGAPVAQAVRGTKDGRLTKSSEESFPAIMSASFGRIDMRKDAKAEALFEVLKTSAAARECEPKAASGVDVESYGLPRTASQIFPRKLYDVCFHSGVGPSTINTEITWLHTDQ